MAEKTGCFVAMVVYFYLCCRKFNARGAVPRGLR